MARRDQRKIQLHDSLMRPPRLEPEFRNQCLACGRSFTRPDALRRHMRTHDQNRAVRVTRKKACVPCIRSKLRCSSQRPKCSTCVKRGATCLYDHESGPLVEINRGILISASGTTQESARPASNGVYSVNTDHAPPELQSLQNDTTIMGNTAPNAFMDLNLSGPFFEGDFQNSFEWMFQEGIDDALMSQTPFTGTDLLVDALPSFRASGLDRQQPSVLMGLLPMTQNSSNARSPVDRLRVPSVENHEYPDDQWPMEWSAAHAALATLPPLGRAGELSTNLAYFSLPKLDLSLISTLKELLTEPSERSFWSGVQLSAFPDSFKLDHCIDRFFVNFDKWVPIIHRPTFDPVREPVVTLAVIAIGACFTKFEGAGAFSNCLMELSRRLLVFMSERDSRFVRTEYYVATQLLHSIYGFSCGNKRFYELAERNRSCLVNNARCAGLFNEIPVDFGHEANLDRRWRNWVRAESFRRVAWAVYAYDASSASMRDDRPFISLNEIKMSLPCPVNHWEAETPQAWVASYPWTDTMPRSENFADCLSNLLDHPASIITAMADNYQRYLMVATLTRMMWSIKEQTTQPGARFLKPYDALVGGRFDLLRIIDHFSFSPEALSSKTTPEQFAARIQQLSLVHLTHIIAADDVWDYLHLIWRKHSQASRAQDHILRWIEENPRSWRAFTVANAQLLSVIRCYPCNHPQEAYNVFHAGMAVWVMSMLAPRTRAFHTHSVVAGLSACNLDWLGPANAPESLALSAWIEKGGVEYIVRMHGVPDLFHPQGAIQILRQTADILNRMSVWGIARTLMNATLRVLHSVE